MTANLFDNFLGGGEELPTMVAGRLKRWALILSTYEYEFLYLPGSKIPNADAMSRLPINAIGEDTREIPIPSEIIFMLKEMAGYVGIKETKRNTYGYKEQRGTSENLEIY